LEHFHIGLSYIDIKEYVRNGLVFSFDIGLSSIGLNEMFCILHSLKTGRIMQGSKLTYVRKSVTDKNPGGHFDFFTYQSGWANSD
jgi:hypothetical protein